MSKYDYNPCEKCEIPVSCSECRAGMLNRELNAALAKRVRWIPVTEQLPPDDTMQLVWAVTKSGHGSVNRAYYFAGVWHGSGSMAGVTHWMPLPTPPEAQQR